MVSYDSRRTVTLEFSNPTPRLYLREKKTYIHANTYIQMSGVELVTIT